MTVTRTAIIAGNWKMNYGPAQAARFATEILPGLQELLSGYAQVTSILCPPAISLPAVRTALDTTPTTQIELGAQNIYYEEKGAYTGEIAASMVRELCSSVILGHSERRTLFHETDDLVNRKTLTALAHGLQPIVCVGETLAEYEIGREVITKQIQTSLANLTPEQARNIVIAYEPVWAIGTGRAATAEGAGAVTGLIRQLYGEMYGTDTAATLRILYGGSVTSTNIGEFIDHPEIDGALVGGASIKPDFVEIVRKTIETMQQS